MPQNLAKIWYELIEDLKHVRVISIPRYYFSDVMDKAESYTLHLFGDASGKAFCTIVNVVMKVHSAYHPRLITSKSRVAPIKPLTMHCIELLAALISARLLNTVRQAFENQVSFESIHCWSDSTTVLYWLKDDRSYKQFVSNRTREISKLIHPDAWGYCPTKEMPAVIGSRGMSATELKDNELWWTGPKWLKGSPENYPPHFTFKELESDECFTKSAKEQVKNLQVNIDEVHEIDSDKIIDIARYSSCNRLL